MIIKKIFETLQIKRKALLSYCNYTVNPVEQKHLIFNSSNHIVHPNLTQEVVETDDTSKASFSTSPPSILLTRTSEIRPNCNLWKQKF